MPIGVSYFGNRILRHVAADMDDLAARGFTGVLHTMSENDLTYYRDALGRIVEISHAAGLFVQVGPWGVGRTFGGEAESLFVANHPHVGQILDSGRPVAAGCLNSEAYREFVRSWAAAAVETGADRIFWDEPHWAHPAHFDEPLERWGCRCPRCVQRWCDETGDDDMPAELTAEVRVFRERCLVEFLRELTAYVASLGATSTVCLLPHTTGSLGVADWSAVARLPGLATLATDPYWKAFNEPVVPFVTEFSERVAQQAAAAGIEPQIWIQGFRLAPEDADDIRAAVTAARAAGVEDLWTWGYEACGHMSYLGTREPERIWEVLCEALTAPPEPALHSSSIRKSGPPEAAPSRLDLGGLVTEQVRPELADLDLRPTPELVRLMASEEAAVSAAVRRAAPDIATAIDAIVARLTDRPEGRIVYVGAGTAGRMGVLDAAECGPTFNAADKFVALMAGGPEAVTKPKEGAEDDPVAGAAELLALGAGPSDAVVGISASGRTPYVLGALGAAREVGALTVGLSCHPGSLVSAAADHAVEVVVGPEVIAGSTRLKAGAAQKLVLNTISTVVMVRLGRTLGNLMVDVRAGSEKLVDRARRIVVTAAGCTPGEAAEALAAADGEVKTAIVTLLTGVDAAAARRRLNESGGVVRRALSAP
ncbi:MAG TPA: N-acetylmuramic acid 6-phosphate etherase [Acidimicrobiia bacterium]|nr:N-acetylmuramic acid 6-phosphate etherase [Acidimicrobiia bacterium]